MRSTPLPSCFSSSGCVRLNQHENHWDDIVGRFDEFSFKAQPGFDEAGMRIALPRAIPLKTLVVYCFDTRAAEIPKVVAEHFGEVYPGENVLDGAGNRVGSTTTVFGVAVAGGRAYSALRSITTMSHLVGIKNVVVVHHSFCGATAYTAEGMRDAFKHEHGVDIAPLYDHDSLCITNFEDSLKYDVALLRKSPGIPKHLKLYGFFYNIDTAELTEVVRDVPVEEAV
jgi:carbonic anhydrase